MEKNTVENNKSFKPIFVHNLKERIYNCHGGFFIMDQNVWPDGAHCIYRGFDFDGMRCEKP